MFESLVHAVLDAKPAYDGSAEVLSDFIRSLMEIVGMVIVAGIVII
ncbi:hypothetical protein KBD45_07505 [Candidatus Dojkabacteria bacterium]|nr:hypothetical protein [Candidatus Dojkabacteria bacterium]